jgi:hypothetical protein
VTAERAKRDKREEVKEARRAWLEEGAIAASKLWVGGWREALRRQGRPAAGGWPGTVAEARAHVVAYFTAELHRRNMPALTHDELMWAAKTAYAAAKRDWRASCEPEPS